MTIKEKYDEYQLKWKTSIKLKGNQWYRWLWYFIAFPWVWIFYNIRDWRTAIIFVIVCALVSSEVWVPYLLAFIFWSNEPWRIALISFASACWVFWLGPGTPFLVICVSLTIGIKALFNKLINRKSKKGER